jgi:predicted RecB family nuclease
MNHRLSKSRFQTGLQCPKALWLTCHARDLADPVLPVQQHIFDTGTRVGELAREAFPGGVLVEEDHTRSAEALDTTAELLEDPPSAIFEAAIQHGGVFVRPDVLVLADDGSWDLYEVKSSTRVKSENITDVAVQTWVLEGAGLPIRRTYLMHLDNTYVFDGENLDPGRLFAANDITDDVRSWIHEVPRRVSDMFVMLDEPVPLIPIGKHCETPYRCAFHGHCHAHLPDDPVTRLPRISAQTLDSLVAADILAIADVPLDFPGLTTAQRTVCELVRGGVPRFDGDVAASLDPLDHPLHFLDFETFMSALPLFAGTRPWQTIQFQWSDHVLHRDGDIEHHEFLYEGSGDPREAFLDSLIETLGDSGSIVVYSPYENTQLNALAHAFPHRAEAIARIQRRLFDLMRVVERHVRHPACLGSSSIKAVLPALVPDLSYDDLEIPEGATASLRYIEAVTGELDEAAAQDTYRALREYCALDTMAMLRLYQTLTAA